MELAQGPGHRGQDDVVHRPAQSVLDRLGVGHGDLGRGEPAVRAHGHVEGPRRRLAQGQQLADASHHLPGLPEEGPGGSHGPADAVGEGPQGVSDRLPARTGQQFAPGRLRLGRPRPGPHLLRFRGEVDQHRGQVHARQPVDHGVVRLEQQAHVAVLQALDEVHLPQRLGPVQRPGVDPLDEVGQLPAAPR
jgi:hypothetical protein